MNTLCFFLHKNCTSANSLREFRKISSLVNNAWRAESRKNTTSKKSWSIGEFSITKTIKHLNTQKPQHKIQAVVRWIPSFITPWRLVQENQEGKYTSIQLQLASTGRRRRNENWKKNCKHRPDSPIFKVFNHELKIGQELNCLLSCSSYAQPVSLHDSRVDQPSFPRSLSTTASRRAS